MRLARSRHRPLHPQVERLHVPEPDEDRRPHEPPWRYSLSLSSLSPSLSSSSLSLSLSLSLCVCVTSECKFREAADRDGLQA
jgi:hypothetical protein